MKKSAISFVVGLGIMPIAVTVFGMYVGGTLVNRWLKSRQFRFRYSDKFKISDIDKLFDATPLAPVERIRLKNLFVKGGVMEEDYLVGEEGYRPKWKPHPQTWSQRGE